MNKPNILIVDDEEDPRDRIKTYLSRRLHCEVKTAPDGKQALELINKEAFDLILLDVKMQGISGMDVLRKTKISSPKTDILMITAYDSHQVAKEALKEGALDCIIKPSSLEAIFGKICHVLEKRNQYLPKDSGNKNTA